MPTPSDPDAVDSFIERWRHAQAAEKSNGQLFLTELAALIGATVPDPAVADTTRDAYVFVRPITYADGGRGISALLGASSRVSVKTPGGDIEIDRKGIKALTKEQQ